jgi:hypothetical protein
MHTPCLTAVRISVKCWLSSAFDEEKKSLYSLGLYPMLKIVMTVAIF